MDVVKRVFLKGKVQGVGFRFHAHEQASKLGLTGWVRNLEDGRVELLIAGQASSVDQMIKWLHKGPATAQVDNVEVHDVKETPPKEPFYIKRETT